MNKILTALESLEKAVGTLETAVNKPRVKGRNSDSPDLFGFNSAPAKQAPANNQFKDRLDSAIAKVESILKEAS